MDAVENHAPARPIHALMSGLIDYAGLFPPAGLGMQAAVENYARYAAGPDAWMLGRFVAPVSRLEEFRKAAGLLLPRNPDSEPWPLSVLVDGDLEADLDAIFAFNHEHSARNAAKNGHTVIDAVEIKAPDEGAAAFIDASLDAMPEDLFPFFELATGAHADFRGAIAALAGADAGAKIRTGGVKREAIPPSESVAGFITACAAADVPFKATAGLHHALRGEHALTYEAGSPRAVMHGFINVFLAAAVSVNMRVDADRLIVILEETDPRSFEIGEHVAAWRGVRLDTAQLVRAREQFALSFGSCSFEEPVQEARQLASF